jgi:hypothetical protein
VSGPIPGGKRPTAHELDVLHPALGEHGDEVAGGQPTSHHHHTVAGPHGVRKAGGEGLMAVHTV